MIWVTPLKMAPSATCQQRNFINTVCSVLICKIRKRRGVGERCAIPSVALGDSYPFIVQLCALIFRRQYRAQTYIRLQING